MAGFLRRTEGLGVAYLRLRAHHIDLMVAICVVARGMNVTQEVAGVSLTLQLL